MKSDESVLIEQLRVGNPAARSEFFREYLPIIRQLVMAAIAEGSVPQRDANELTQDVAVSFLKRLTRLKKFSKHAIVPSLEQELEAIVTHRASLGQKDYKEPPRTRFGPDRYRKRRGFGLDRFVDPEAPKNWFGLEAEEPNYLVINTSELLTPDLLESTIVPCLQAVVSMQHVCDDLKNKEHFQAVVTSISQRSPVTVGFEGVGDALTAIREDVIPWRKANAKKIADISARGAEVEVRIKEAEALDVRARSAKGRAEAKKIAAEAFKIRQEAERLRLENEKLHFEMQSAKLQLAIDIVSKMRPDLSDKDRLVHAFNMMKSIGNFLMADIDVKLLE